MIVEHTKILEGDDQKLSKNSKPWCNNGQMKKTKNEKNLVHIAIENVTTITIKIEPATTILGIITKVIKTANASLTILLQP